MNIVSKFNIDDELYVLIRGLKSDDIEVAKYNVDKIEIGHDKKLYYVDCLTDSIKTSICEEDNIIFRTYKDANKVAKALRSGKITWEELWKKEER